eukprot:TRINITY_DN2387_c0_g1_i1.p1 TRINITY_DN2387_c0_g1~~TRINITY_DN2387_c0_g1_i1.p1  ORF type:complete len:112 (+),score=22.29 TRINITY_DN2387_c0_g1_i1:171-506(+)
MHQILPPNQTLPMATFKAFKQFETEERKFEGFFFQRNVYEVRVKRLEGAPRTFFLSEDSTVEDLRRTVERDWAGIPECNQRLVYNGQELTTGPLAAYGIKSGASIYVIKKK